MEIFQCPLCIKRFKWKNSLSKHLNETHQNSPLAYEKRLAEGKKLLDFMVEECVPVAVMPYEDMKLVNLYRQFTYQQIDTWTDSYVPM